MDKNLGKGIAAFGAWAAVAIVAVLGASSKAIGSVALCAMIATVFIFQ